jgi:hypothetical protein
VCERVSGDKIIATESMSKHRTVCPETGKNCEADMFNDLENGILVTKSM